MKQRARKRITLVRVCNAKQGQWKLMKAAMRHKPKRVVLGELQSSEVLELMKSWNAGHAGTIYSSGVCMPSETN